MNAYLHIRQCAFAALILACAQQGRAQDNYLFEHVQPGDQPYESLLGDTEITGFDLSGSFALPGLDGQTIRLFDKMYTLGLGTRLLINADGYVRVDDGNTTAEIDGAFTDLYPFDETSRYSYRLFGNPGNHILAVQYSNMRLATGVTGNAMSMQIWYYQNTGMIEVRFGPRTANLASGFTLSRGPKMGIHHSPVDMSSCLEKVWLSGIPQAPDVSYDANHPLDGMSGVPQEGTIYRYVPTFTIGLDEQHLVSRPTIRNNPATDVLFVTIHDATSASFAILDMAGRTLWTQRAVGGENVIDVSTLSSGTYLLVDQSNGSRHAQRFVKQ